MAITTKPPASPGIPNSKTTVSENNPSIPVSKTTVSESAAGIPVSKTTVSESAAAIPVSKTTVSEASPAIPVSKTTVSESSAAIPVSKTTIPSAGVPRALIPLVDMHFDSETFSQNGNAVLFDDLFTYARNSSATFINRRIVNNKAEFFLDTDFVGTVTNLLTFSEQFDNGDWAKANSSIIANATQSPINDTTADRLIEALDSSSVHLLRRSESFTSGTDYTISVFVKANGRSQLAITAQAPAVSGGYRAIFDLPSESVISRSQPDKPASITSAGNDWFLCSITFNADATNSANVEFELSKGGTVTYDGDGSSGLFVWGGQMTESAKPEPYVKTTGSSDSLTFTESLRIEYDVATGDNLGALIEGASTNLALRSEEFENASWSKSNSSITENATKAPDDTFSADNLIEDSTASSTHQAQQVLAHTSGLTYTMSVFAKAKERTEINIYFGPGAFPPSVDATFDLSTGEIISQGGNLNSASIKAMGDGWFRCEITAEADVSTNTNSGVRISLAGSDTYDGDGSSGLYVWGAQVEEQPFATSYIRTEGSTVARAIDALDIPQAGNISDQGDFTSFARASVIGNDDNTLQYIFEATTTSGNVFMNQNSSDDRYRFKRGGAGINSNTDFMPGVFLDVAMVFDFSTNVVSGFTDGVNSGSGDAGSILILDGGTIKIGTSNSGSSGLNGHIKKFTIYEEALTAQEVALL